MSQIWFINSNDVITGPFSTTEVNVKLTTGQCSAASFIWWKGQREWIPINTWKENLAKIVEAMNNQRQKAIWYIDVGTSPIGPLTQNELIANLKAMSELGRVRLWAVGMQKWMSLFEVHDVMELLGISRREHDRVPLLANVAITRSNEDPKGFMVRAASISLGGIGIVGEHDLRRGDEIAVLIKSNDLGGNIHVRGDVVYTTAQGYCGIRFGQVPAETQSLILDYVRRFHVEVKAAA